MPKFLRFTRGLFYLFLIIIISTPNAHAQEYQFHNEPAILVFNEIQEQSEYRFLYRESLVSDVRFTFSTPPDSLVKTLESALVDYNLTIRVDSVGRQLLILPINNSTGSNTFRVSGQIVDAETGERLPFGTLSWVENGIQKGQVASKAGTFQLQISPVQSQSGVTLETSYVGYQKASVTLDPKSNHHIRDLTIRLRPQSVTGSEIVVLGNDYYSPQDSSLTGLIKTDRFSPLGEGNAVRALQVLPSVGATTAMNDGLHIRGSSPDGFHLELDEITIFNQSHLFGLLDSFNEDAVLNSGFFYDVAPAHIHAPIGGKLSLTTRNGSLHKTGGTGSLSNTSVRTTIDGPIKKGKSSWLISGRTSYMNQLNWFNSENLIRWGLDVNRPKSDVGSGNINADLVSPLRSDVYYFDLHGKIYSEQEDGSRTMLSLYFGGDRTKHLANRLTKTNSLQERFREVEVETENRWNNFAISAQHQRELSTSVYSNSTFGLSAYETLFNKDDFLYTNTSRSGETVQTTVFTYPLSNRSTMNRGKIDQTFDIVTETLDFKTGFTAIYHRGEYQEESFDRQNFYTITSALQADLFFQTEYSPVSFADLQAGIRSHYFTAGNSFRLSPRLKANFFEGQDISFSLGYSNNHQFINRIGFSNAVTADVWILSNEDQPPSSVEQVTAGFYMKPYRRLYFQVEGYLKDYENLRSHELNARSLTDTFTDSPWFFQNSGNGKGVEFLVRNRFSFFTVTQTYTLSSTQLRNEFLNQGEDFYAPWDRTHAATTNLEIEITPNIRLFASSVVASGAVTGTFDTQHGEMSRLGTYHRLDLSALLTREIGGHILSGKLSVFNVLDRENPWYQEYQPVIVTQNTIPAIRSEIVDVYDLGIQPSFEVKIDF